MKIIYFATYYDAYLDAFYKVHPELSSFDYILQNARLREDHFGIFGSYTDYALQHGHEAHLIVANCKAMQQKWARENDFPWDEKNWSYSVAAQQVKKIRPDIFFTGSMFPYYHSFIDEIKPYCKKITGWISCPIPGGVPYNKLSLILTSAPHYAENFRKEGITSELLLPAFDKKILNYIDKKAPQNNFTFIGSLSGHHQLRNQYLQLFVKNTAIKIYGIAGTASRKEKLLDLLKPSSIKNHFLPPVFGNAMYSMLAASKITFNIHIDFMKDFAGNMRLFEATGAGTMLLTDHKKNIHLLFEPGKEIVTYHSPGDAAEKVKYYLAHEEERKKIAEAGYQRTLKDYNFENIIEKMLNLFREHLHR